jgi:hypothetical protein
VPFRVNARQFVEQGWELSGHPSEIDAPARLVFAHAEVLDTIRKQRAVCGGKMQAPFFDFPEMRDQLRQRATLPAQHAVQTFEQLLIGEMCQPPEVLLVPHDVESTPRIFRALRAPPLRESAGEQH